MGEKQLEGFLSLENACAFLGGMDKKTLGDKARSGEIKSYKVGKHRIFDRSDLIKYVKTVGSR